MLRLFLGAANGSSFGAAQNLQVEKFPYRIFQPFLLLFLYFHLTKEAVLQKCTFLLI